MNNAARITLITGGSRGLGRSAALHLADRGVDVLFTYRSAQAEAAEVVREIEARGARGRALRFDAEDAEGYDAFVEAVKSALADWSAEHLDHLVNNAGVGHHAPFAETTEAAFDQMVNIHLRAPFLITQKLLPVLRDGGSILNVSTGLARFSLPGYAAYAMVKGGIETLTRYQAKELGARGIRVNTLAPGAIETDFGGGMVRDNPDVNGFIASQTALGRVGRPDDIGAAVAALLGDELAWTTGQRIELSGGMFL